MAHELLSRLDEDGENYGLARPLDRLAAFVVDLLILYPIVQLIQAPFRYQLQESLLHDQDVEAASFRLLLVVVFSCCFVFYNGIGIGLFGQTIGKRFFNIRVVFLKGHHDIMSGFARASLMLIELLALGFPMLAVFSNRWRRPLHDRVVDSMVVSSVQQVSYPTRLERQVAYLFALAFGLFATLILLVSTLLKTSVDPSAPIAADANVVNDLTCRGFEELHGLDLDKAITDFTDNELSAECLKQLSTAALWKNQDNVLANLGIVFAHYNQQDLVLPYITEVCRLDAHGIPCQFLQWAEKDPLASGSHLPEITAMLKKSELADFYKIYFIAALQANGDFESAEEVIRQVNRPADFGHFLPAATFRNLMEQRKWDAGYWVFKVKSLPAQDFVDYVEGIMATKRFSRHEIKDLLEGFYPHLRVSSGGRRIASTEEAPAKIKMLWIKLGDDE